MTKKGKILLISAPSGTGKGAVIGALRARRDDIEYSISWTTRQKRDYETDGKDYFFKTEQEFVEKIEAGGFLEHAGLYGRRYGTPADYVYGKLSRGKHIILEIDTQGALQVMKNTAPQDMVSVFMLPPSMHELHSRLTGRGTETPEKINERFATAYGELEMAHHYKYCVVNDVVEDAAARIEKILDGEGAQYEFDERTEAFVKRLKEEKLS